MLVLIGPGWIDARDEQGHRRLDNPDDWVRLEIAHELKRKITVIPVQINRARRCPTDRPPGTSGACWIISPRRSRTPAFATTWPDWSGTSGQFRLPGRGDGLWRSLRQWRRSSVSDSDRTKHCVRPRRTHSRVVLSTQHGAHQPKRDLEQSRRRMGLVRSK